MAGLRARVRSLAATEIAPYAALVDASRYFPLEGYDALRADGLHAPYLPTGFGGAGLGESAACAVIEELARACGSCALIPAANLLGAAPLLLAGDAEIKQRYLTPVADGEALITAAMFEDAGDAEEVTCRAVRGGSGTWKLFGAKPRVVNAGVAHYYTVLAATDPAGAQEDGTGLSVFVLEDGDEGFELGERLPQRGVTGIPARRLVFHGVELGPDRLVGTAGDGLRIARRTREYGQVALAAHAVGLAQGALDVAVTAGYVERGRATWQEAEMLVSRARDVVAQAALALETAAPTSADAAAKARAEACTAANRVTRWVGAWSEAEAATALTGTLRTARAAADRLQRDARALAWPAVAELERQGTDLAA
jgi:alkylation response protein AidB-like acyl-CoA dehydrogenase